MSEDFNTGQGRISGKPENVGDDIAGKVPGKVDSGTDTSGKIPGDDTPGNSAELKEKIFTERLPENNTKTRIQRIVLATQKKGLKSLPQNFGDNDGDWQIIESENLFEVLYLDHKQIISINPDIVKNNFTLLEKFWKEKRNLWESGSGQVRKSIEDKYGVKNLTNCIKKIQHAYEQLFSLEKINEYNEGLRVQRLQNAEVKLEPLLRMMTKNGQAEPNDIEGIIDEGLRYDLDADEGAVIIKKVIDAKGFKPYGTPSGDLLKEKLLSVSWMSEEKLKEAKAEAEAKKNAGREIFDNVYAYSVEEIGEIIFSREKEAKRDIADGLLKNSIDYFSPAKARQFIDIVNTQKNQHLQYLQIVYRLKPQLPYRFTPTQLARSPQELCEMMFKSPDSFRLGKEQFKNGYPEVWFMETNKEAYVKLVSIRDRAENSDTAFIEFLYTFNPSLPYRFAGRHHVTTPEELCTAINNSKENWEAGKAELFDSSIPVWLATTKYNVIPWQWNKVKDEFKEKKDIGLEYFLHLLDDKLEHTRLGVNHSSISYPRIQSGQVIKTNLVFTNETRGALEATISFSKNIPGVSISVANIAISNASGISIYQRTLTIDSTVLLKGVNYETSIQVTTSEQQKIEIPLAFKIVFPRNAFMLEIAKYAGLFAVFLVLVRLILSSEYPTWLNNTFHFFLQWQGVVIYTGYLSIFGWAFLTFIGILSWGGYYLIKYILKK